jgi:hypothetical protein
MAFAVLDSFPHSSTRFTAAVAAACMSFVLASCATTTNPWDARTKKVMEDSTHSSYVTALSPAAAARQHCYTLMATSRRYATCLQKLQQKEDACKHYADAALDAKKGGAGDAKATGTAMLAGGYATGMAIGAGAAMFVPGLSLLAPVALAGMAGGATMRANADNEMIRVWEESFDECWHKRTH